MNSVVFYVCKYIHQYINYVNVLLETDVMLCHLMNSFKN